MESALRPIPGVMLDDAYRLLGDRSPAAVLLEVEAIEPEATITRIRYRLVDAGGEPLLDAVGKPLAIAGGTDAPPPGLRVGDRLAIPGRGAVGTPIRGDRRPAVGDGE